MLETKGDKMNLKAIGLVIAGVLVIACIGLVMVFPIYFLWNWLMPVIFGLPKITFLQSLGIWLLSSLLFRETIKVSKNGK